MANRVREAHIQRSIVSFLGPLRDAGCLNFYVNIEGSRRDARQQAALKRDGVRPGRADLHVLLPKGDSLLIELKRKPDGRLSEHQKCEIEINSQLGHRTVVLWANDEMDGVNQIKDLLRVEGVYQ